MIIVQTEIKTIPYPQDGYLNKAIKEQFEKEFIPTQDDGFIEIETGNKWFKFPILTTKK